MLGSEGISLYLHIGMPKTGTTALQHFLDASRDDLMRTHGFFYPEGAVPTYQHVSLVKSMVAPVFNWAKFNDRIGSFDVDNYLKALISTCRLNRCDSVILSSEYFWAAPAMQAGLDHHLDNEENRSFLEDFVKLCKVHLDHFSPVKIIVYLRRQDYWFDSFFNEQLKHGFKIPSEEELIPPKIYLHYDTCVRMWEEHFGPKNVIVRTYLENGFEIINDFCSVVGIRQEEISAKPNDHIEYKNIRLTPIASAAMKKAIQLGYDETVLELLKKVLRHTSNFSTGQTEAYKLTLFSREFYEKILAIYEKENTLLAGRHKVVALMINQGPFWKSSGIEKRTVEFSFEQQVEHLVSRLIEKQMQSKN